MDGEFGIGAGKTGDKMVLPAADRLLSWVGSVIVGRNQLIFNFFLAHERLESRRTLIVQELDHGGEAAGDEVVVDDGKGSGEFFVVATFKAFG